jgi:hypothetical protein
MSLPNEYVGEKSRWAIHIDNIRFRWEPLAMRWEGGECGRHGGMRNNAIRGGEMR